MSYTQHLKLRLSPGLTSDAVYNLQKIDSLASTFKVDTRAGLRLRSIEDIIIEPHSADIGGDGVGGSLSIGTPDHLLESIYFYGSVHFSEGLDNSDIAADAAIEWAKISKGGSSLQDIEDRSHSHLSDIGFNTHEQIDSFITAVQAYIDNPELTPEDLSVPPGLDGQVLSIQGGGFKWTSVQTDNLSEYSIRVGNVGGEAQSVNTSTEGGILASVGGLNYKAESIENSHIAGDASIEFSKMEALTPDRVNLTSAEGVVSTSSITGTELGYLAGLEEPITDTFDSIAESISDITDLFGEPDGLATLGSDGKLTSSQIPESLVGAVVFQGTWDALVNDPTLQSGVGTKGHYYIVNMEGSTDLDGETSWKVGDWAIFSGTAWQKVDNTDAVISVNSKTGVVVLGKTDVGLGNVDNTSDLAKNSAVATLTNKTLVKPIVDDYFDINEEASPTAPASGKVRVYAKNDKKLYRKDSTGVEQEIGSGAGGVGVSFFYDDFENGSTSNWLGYDDGASVVPVDGTGGTASALTVEASSSSPLRGGFSLSVSKDNTNAQGQGVAASFTIPSGYQQGAKRVLEFLWDGSDANYATGDMRVYIFDVTNSTLITPEVSPQLPAAKTPIQLSWDASSSASYRLIFHVATTNSSAWSVKIDDVTVGPGEVIPVPAIGSVTLTPTLGNATGLSPDFSKLKTYRVGDKLLLHGQISFGGDGTSTNSLMLSFSGLTFVSDYSGHITLVKEGTPDVGVNALLVIANSSQLGVRPVDGSTTVAANIIGTSFGTSSGRYSSIVFDGVMVSINEWADSPTYVASAKQAVVSTKANRSSQQTGINPNNSVVQLVYNNVLENVGGGTWDGGGFVVPETGDYLVGGSVLFDSTNVLNTAYRLQVIAGSSFAGGTVRGEIDWHVPAATTFFGLYGSTKVRLTAGTKVYLGLFTIGNHSVNTLGTTGATLPQFNMWVSRLTDEYGRPVVGFGYATADSYGLVKLASGANAAEARVENLTVGSISSTFTSNGTGGGTSSAVDILVRRQGNWVDVVIPAFNADAGTGTPTSYISNTALPAWARPNVNTIMSSGISRNNGGTDINEANIFVNTTGVISVRRNAATATFTTSASAGLQTVANIRYYVP